VTASSLAVDLQHVVKTGGFDRQEAALRRVTDLFRSMPPA
jgi:hypothetical protein